MKSKKLLPIIVILLGIGAFIVALMGILIGMGGKSGFGLKKALLALVGITLILKGIDLNVSSHAHFYSHERPEKGLSNRWILFLGSINIICYTVYSMLSYGLAPLIPDNIIEPYRLKIFVWISQTLAFLGRDVQAFTSGNSILSNREFWLIAYCLPVIISTIVFFIMLIILWRYRDGIGSDIPKYLFRWAMIFAAILFLACPVLTPDFWYPLNWGRMVVAGINPYYTELLSVTDLINNMPLGGTHEKMMYGPLWAVISGVVMWFSGEHALVGAILFKLLLIGVWIGSLWLVWAILQDQPLWNQCVGILIFGWLPLGVMQAVGEGHNDIVMIMLILFWLYSLKKKRTLISSLSLAASILLKYISLPLFVLDLIHFLVSQKKRLLNYSPQAIAAGGIIVIGLGLFYRSPEFFAYLTTTSQWNFYSPKEAITTFLSLFGLALPFSNFIVRLFFILVALYYVIHYIQKPERYEFWIAILAVMSAMLFGISSHVWPWYLVWVLGFATLAPASAMSQWVLGVAIATPFLLVVTVMFPELNDFSRYDTPTLILYSFAILWLITVPRRWFPSSVG